LFTKHVDDILIVQIYVNIIFGSINEKLCKDFESCMEEEIGMSMMGELTISLDSKSRSDEIFINQAKYTRELIKKFGLEDAKISKTLMTTTTKLDKDEQGKNINIKLYCSMIVSLLYLTASRLNIIFSFCCLCFRFQSCLKKSHLIAVKHIIIYLQGIIEMGLWYLKTEQFSMMSYSDADYAGCRVDKNSTKRNSSIFRKLPCFVVFQKQNPVPSQPPRRSTLRSGLVMHKFIG